MKKTLLAIAAILLMTSAMAQNSEGGKRGLFSTGGGVSYQFVEHGGSVDLDLEYLDVCFGWYNYEGAKQNNYAFCATHPYTLNLGKFLFIRPTIGFGYIYNEVKILDVTKKTNAVDFLLFPKAGFQIPLGDISLTIYASFRYDAPSFKFERENKGTWGVGLGINM